MDGGADGARALFEREIAGTYLQLSKKYLDGYLDEIEWRFNHRENHWLFWDTIRKLLTVEKLEHKKLTA